MLTEHNVVMFSKTKLHSGTVGAVNIRYSNQVLTVEMLPSRVEVGVSGGGAKCKKC